MILVGLIFVCAILIGTAWANTLYYGPNLNYSEVVLPNNSYVHQGENISQGNYYDLSGVYGFSGVLAHWNDDYNAGVTEPDLTYTIAGSPYSVYIDPATFPPGQYYQWDGGTNCGANSISGTSNYFSNGVLVTSTPGDEGSSCMGEFGNDNTYVFTVVARAAPQYVPVVHTMNVTETVGNQTIIIPVTYTDTITATPVPVITEAQTIVVPTTATPTPSGTQDAVDINGDPINGVSTNFQTVTTSPVPVDVTLCGLVGAIGILVWRREKE